MKYYEEFLKFEKSNNDVFLKKNQLNHEFDENEYSFIKFFFEDCTAIFNNKNPLELTFEAIDKIYDEIGLENLVIDTDYCDQSFPTFFRYLVLGDFLFSFRSSSIKEPSELIFRFERASYLNYIKYTRRVINFCFFNINYVNYTLFHQKLFIALTNRKVLIKEVIRKKIKKFSSTTYYQLCNHVTANLSP